MLIALERGRVGGWCALKAVAPRDMIAMLAKTAIYLGG
jgi:hypothetical protein